MAGRDFWRALQERRGEQMVACVVCNALTRRSEALLRTGAEAVAPLCHPCCEATLVGGMHVVIVAALSPAAAREHELLHAAVVDVEAADAAEDARILQDELGIDPGPAVPETPEDEYAATPESEGEEGRACDLCRDEGAAEMSWGEYLCEACAECQMPDRG